MDEASRDNFLKTAEYVKQHGKKFEEKLLNSSDEKFAFLRPEHEHHEFYRSLFNVENDTTESVEKSKTRRNMKKKKTVRGDRMSHIPAKPKRFVFSSYDSKDVSSQALHIIQRTAEFCARSSIGPGDKSRDDTSIIELLRAKSMGDETFDFLNSKHRLNSLFLDFLNQYKQVVSPYSKKTNQKAAATTTIPQIKLLETCFKRAEYNEYMKHLSSRNTEIKRLYAIRFAAINWADIRGDESNNNGSSSNSKRDRENGGSGSIGGNRRRKLIPMKLWAKQSNNTEKSSSTTMSGLYMKPLDFKQLSKKNLSTSLVRKSIEEYFKEGSLNLEQTEQSSPADSKKGKKRKNKIVVREAGETRLKRKKQRK